MCLFCYYTLILGSNFSKSFSQFARRIFTFSTLLFLFVCFVCPLCFPSCTCPVRVFNLIETLAVNKSYPEPRNVRRSSCAGLIEEINCTFLLPSFPFFSDVRNGEQRQQSWKDMWTAGCSYYPRRQASSNKKFSEKVCRQKELKKIMSQTIVSGKLHMTTADPGHSIVYLNFIIIYVSQTHTAHWSTNQLVINLL